MFVTNWISTTKIQKISEITNFFRHYFLSRTEVECSLLAITLLIGYLLKVVHAEIIQVHLAVHLLRSAFLACLRPKVEILQADVTAEAAYQVEAQHGAPLTNDSFEKKASAAIRLLTFSRAS